MANQDKNEVLTTYTSDVHALVTHGVRAIGRQVEQLKDVSHVDAKTAVVAFERNLKLQQSALEDRVKALGGTATGPVKDAVSAIAGVAAGLIDAVRPSETVKAIRDDHAYFSLLGVSWLMLYTTATSLADAETAALAERGYQETTKMILHVDRILPKLVTEELAENKQLHPIDVREQARVMVKNAWDREAPQGA